MKYGAFNYDTAINWGQQVSSFTADSSTSISFAVAGAFGHGYFGLGYFGNGEEGAYTVAYSNETPTTISYT